MPPVFVDSHCHLDFPELADRIGDVLNAMARANVIAALCPGVCLEDFDRVSELVHRYRQLYGAVAVHPGYDKAVEPTVEDLVDRASGDKIVAIGETGLDYHYHKGDLTWQRERFKTHIRAACTVGKPLIVHCREAASDLLQILKDEGAERVGGVMHCFSEDIDTARAVLDLGFYLSFSGVVTFKNAEALREVVKAAPIERILIETDSPYLAPAPHRGRMNEPAYVVHVAQKIADVKAMPLETVAQRTTENFYHLFHLPPLA